MNNYASHINKNNGKEEIGRYAKEYIPSMGLYSFFLRNYGHRPSKTAEWRI
jgi:hypothetical protein